MKLLTVKNWRQFQHYTKRNPPWIKLHRALLEDYDFAHLDDVARSHLILIWLLAAGNDGSIVADEKFIQQKIGASSRVNLKNLIDAGFLIAQDGAEISEPKTKGNGADHQQDDTPVVERIPMIGGEEFEVKESFAKELERLYPNVDVPATLRQMRGWCIGNPTKLKTPRGIRKFITGWCERDQNGR